MVLKGIPHKIRQNTYIAGFDRLGFHALATLDKDHGETVLNNHLLLSE